MTKLKDPTFVKNTLLPKVKKHAPKLAAKLALSSGAVMVPEGISTGVGVLGLAWTAYDLAQLASSVPEIAKLFK